MSITKTSKRTRATGRIDDNQQDKPTIKRAIDRYLSDINALEFAYPLTIGAIDASSETYTKAFAKSLAADTDPSDLKKFVRAITRMAKVTKDEADESKAKKRGKAKSFSIPLKGKDEHLLENVKNLSKVGDARQLVSRSFVVTLVSQFDAYIAGLVRALHEIRPDILNLHAKTISYSDIVELGDVASVEERLIENEIDSLLRSSHSDQFKWLESKLEMRLKEVDSKWAAFIELTERRNLFVHANARVSSQYLRVCKNNKVALPLDCRIGSTLPVSNEYFSASYSLLAEIGVKLGIILWRKAAASEQPEADSHLIEVTLNLIKSGKYALARSILEDFLFSIPAGDRTESTKRTMIINLAQSMKWLGQEEDCEKLLKRFDWSATSPLFNLAIAVLKDDFAVAKKFSENLASRRRNQKEPNRIVATVQKVSR